jgi:hypothetical protein
MHPSLSKEPDGAQTTTTRQREDCLGLADKPRWQVVSGRRETRSHLPSVVEVVGGVVVDVVVVVEDVVVGVGGLEVVGGLDIAGGLDVFGALDSVVTPGPIVHVVLVVVALGALADG